MTATVERHEFQAEVQQVLELLVHSLYSHKDIFLRELISNASDALDKFRFAGLTDPKLRTDEELHIRITRDTEERTLAVSDNGIGMNRAELIENLGTIAHSGSTHFLRALQKSKDEQGSLDLIGQFGVGFYSSFMVADKVTVLSRRAGEEKAYKWESTGTGEYTVEESERTGNGTTVMLHLRPVDEEDGLQDYAAEWVIKGIVKHHSDFVAHPIKMEVEREETPRDEEGKPREGAAPEKVVTDETLNSMQAIWTRAKEDVTEEEYQEFYKHITHDWSNPLSHLSIRMEGAVEARALLYIPSQAPIDLYHHEISYRGLQLFIKRVFIMDECKDLMPPHLRFIKGVVDSDDLSLNVSREILQQDRKIGAIRKFLVKKVMEELARLQKHETKTYRDFWKHFGPAMKEGFLSMDQKHEPLLDLLLCHSTRNAEEMTALADYVVRMPDGQDAIYYLTSPTIDAARQSPHLEVFQKKGYEVLLFTDRVDEVWLPNAPAFQEKQWRSVGQGSVDLGTEEEQKEASTALETQTRDFKDLTTLFQELLADDIKEVRPTNRLTSSPACLVGEPLDMSPQMTEILRQMGQDVPKVKRILEVNPAHPILQKLQARFEKDERDPVVREFAELLYGQALLAEGSQPNDPAGFGKKLADVLQRGL
ncbi:MAG: molecular chaperone HtpG [Gemmatimonadetes bacterium]|nr:molecular chaperone HtpG [Gemmatimonadota bacterium]